nr:MAG TPA: SRP54-type protein, GTPase domain [Caudoviricetes sp.]
MAMRIVVFGKSGIGKTRIVNHIAKSIQSDGSWLGMIDASKWQGAPLNDDSVEYDDNGNSETPNVLTATDLYEEQWPEAEYKSFIGVTGANECRIAEHWKSVLSDYEESLPTVLVRCMLRWDYHKDKYPFVAIIEKNKHGKPFSEVFYRLDADGIEFSKTRN